MKKNFLHAFKVLVVLLVTVGFVGGPLLGSIPTAWAADAVYYLYNDHLGTPKKATNASGFVVWEASARPFGQTEVSTETITQNLRFPGQYSDAESGLHYNYQRTYHPGLGRYLEPDPLGQHDSANVYPYAVNNPVNLLDRTGEAVDTAADVFFILWDVHDIFFGDECEREENITALGLDVIGAMVPFATGLGKSYKVAKAANSGTDYLKIVDNLDFSTGKNKAVFYSGPGNHGKALSFAEKTGKTPIDFTPGGKYLDSLDLYSKLPAEQADAVWAAASKKYASGASGQINLFINKARSDRVFRTIEEPILNTNTDISRWTYRGE